MHTHPADRAAAPRQVAPSHRVAGWCLMVAALAAPALQAHPTPTARAMTLSAPASPTSAPGPQIGTIPLSAALAPGSQPTALPREAATTIAGAFAGHAPTPAAAAYSAAGGVAVGCAALLARRRRRS